MPTLRDAATSSLLDARTLRRALICVVFAPTILAAQGGSKSTALPRAKVTVVRPDGSIVGTTSRDSTHKLLDTTRVTVTEGATLKDLLRAEYVRPDVDALNWVYTANPRMRHADSLRVGDVLLLPSGKSLKAAGDLPGNAKLAIHSSATRGFLGSRSDMYESLFRIDDGARWQTRDGHALASKLHELSLGYALIDAPHAGSSKPADEYFSRQLTEIQQLVARWSSSDAVATPEAVAAVDAAARQAATFASVASSGAMTTPVVKVRPLLSGAGTPVVGLRLQYVAALLFRPGGCMPSQAPLCGDEFQSDGPEYSTPLVYGGEYFVWAVRNGTLASCARPVSPRIGGPLEWSLEVFAQNVVPACPNPEGR